MAYVGRVRGLAGWERKVSAGHSMDLVKISIYHDNISAEETTIPNADFVTDAYHCATKTDVASYP